MLGRFARRVFGWGVHRCVSLERGHMVTERLKVQISVGLWAGAAAIGLLDVVKLAPKMATLPATGM